MPGWDGTSSTLMFSRMTQQSTFQFRSGLTTETNSSCITSRLRKEQWSSEPPLFAPLQSTSTHTTTTAEIAAFCRPGSPSGDGRLSFADRSLIHHVVNACCVPHYRLVHRNSAYLCFAIQQQEHAGDGDITALRRRACDTPGTSQVRSTRQRHLPLTLGR